MVKIGLHHFAKYFALLTNPGSEDGFEICVECNLQNLLGPEDTSLPAPKCLEPGQKTV